MCLCVYPSKRIHVAICGPIGTKFGTHMQIHLERVVGKKICPCDLGGTWGVLGGQKFKNLKKLPNGWTDWHQIWHTCSDLSGNGHKLKTIVPRDPRGALGRGGGKGSKIKHFGKSTKRLDRMAPHLAYMCGFIWEWTKAKKQLAPR